MEREIQQLRSGEGKLRDSVQDARTTLLDVTEQVNEERDANRVQTRQLEDSLRDAMQGQALDREREAELHAEIDELRAKLLVQEGGFHECQMALKAAKGEQGLLNELKEALSERDLELRRLYCDMAVLAADKDAKLEASALRELWRPSSDCVLGLQRVLSLLYEFTENTVSERRGQFQAGTRSKIDLERILHRAIPELMNRLEEALAHTEGSSLQPPPTIYRPHYLPMPHLTSHGTSSNLARALGGDQVLEALEDDSATTLRKELGIYDSSQMSRFIPTRSRISTAGILTSRPTTQIGDLSTSHLRPREHHTLSSMSRTSRSRSPPSRGGSQGPGSRSMPKRHHSNTDRGMAAPNLH